MKNNLNYYSHAVDAHLHWKFKTLRRKYGWAGEGRFWALNNIIANSENCELSLDEVEKINEIAADLDLSEDDFNAFIEFLEQKCKLLLRQDNIITTEKVQENLYEVGKKRNYQRSWKKKKSNIDSDNSSIETKESNIETQKSNIEKQQRKVKEIKVNKIKDVVDDNARARSPEISKKILCSDLPNELLKISSDEPFLQSIERQNNISQEKIAECLLDFGIFQKDTKHPGWSNESDLRKHILAFIRKQQTNKQQKTDGTTPNSTRNESRNDKKAKSMEGWRTVYAQGARAAAAKD